MKNTWICRTFARYMLHSKPAGGSISVYPKACKFPQFTSVLEDCVHVTQCVCYLMGGKWSIRSCLSLLSAVNGSFYAVMRGFHWGGGRGGEHPLRLEISCWCVSAVIMFHRLISPSCALVQTPSSFSRVISLDPSPAPFMGHFHLRVSGHKTQTAAAMKAADVRQRRQSPPLIYK